MATMVTLCVRRLSYFIPMLRIIVFIVFLAVSTIDFEVLKFALLLVSQ